MQRIKNKGTDGSSNFNGIEIIHQNYKQKNSSHNNHLAKINRAKIKQNLFLKNRSGHAYLITKSCKPFTRNAAIFSKAHQTRSDCTVQENTPNRAQSELYSSESIPNGTVQLVL